MRALVKYPIFLLACLMAAPVAEAQSGTFEITVTYRERIALPPDAQLDVQLLDLSRAGAVAPRLSSQRVAITGVPMTVRLAYDPAVISDEGRYAAFASIWSGDRQIFRTTRPNPVPEGGGAVDLVLSMVPHAEVAQTPPRTLSGVIWAVTEIGGAPWGNSSPATLSIDDAMNVSIFGGCNRFTVQAIASEGSIAFPDTFAGTLMACPEAVEARERRFLGALAHAAAYVRYGAGLVLTDGAGNALLHFEERLGG